MRLLSIQISPPRIFGEPNATDPLDREWTTAIYKETIPGPVWMSHLGLAGDGQADLTVHGGPDKAINVYPADHYAAWESELGLKMPPGAFGENFTTLGLTESEVCIGDVFSLGETRLQISQPRQPCWKLARRWRIKDLPFRVQENGKTGWYFRVLEEGNIVSGLEFELIDRPFPEWTVAEANEIMHHRKDDREAARALSICPALSQNWQQSLARRA